MIVTAVGRRGATPDRSVSFVTGVDDSGHAKGREELCYLDTVDQIKQQSIDSHGCRGSL